MVTTVVICDDSAAACQRLARALPQDWDIELAYAATAREAVSAARAGKAEVLFLNLTLPDMDGYQTLRYLATIGRNPEVIITSGELQPSAQRRLLDLGARAILKKPIDSAELRVLLQKLGRVGEQPATASVRPRPEPPISDIRTHDALQEVVKIAVGEASSLLGRLWGVSVNMAVPQVVQLEPADLRMMLAGAKPRSTVSTICQGFFGEGVAGEALINFNDMSYGNLAQLMKFDGELDRTVEIELLMDLANVQVGASLKGIADQLDIRFNLSHPAVIGQRSEAARLLADFPLRWNRTLAVELEYEIADYRLNSEVLLVFTEDSLDPLNKRLEYAFA